MFRTVAGLVIKGTRRSIARSPASRLQGVVPLRNFASIADTIKNDTKKPLVNVRKQLWDFYLSTGHGANALFEAIDLRENGFVEPAELKSFMEEVLSTADGEPLDPKELMPYAWNLLETREADGKMYDMRSFKQWLVAATKMSADTSNNRLLQYLAEHPHMDESYFSEKEEKDVYTWNEETMSQEIVMRADKMLSEGREILFTNIGNPHQVGQHPITFYRQVLSLCDLPAEVGVDHPNVLDMYPADVVARAKEYREIVGPSGTGAYTHSQGLMGFRKHVAEFIQNRDGYPAYPDNIFLTNGASSGIEMVLSGLMANNNDAVMIPIPQYPIYSALIAKLGGHQIGYNLDESLNWAVTREELENQYKKALKEGLDVKALALINPGNPSGNVMSHVDIQVVAEFCDEHGIVLLADEVYQANVYTEGAEFVSAKRVALDCGLKNLQLVSFHSTSKGLTGECGRRGGYMELHHIDPYVHAQLYKLASSGLCSGVSGQIMVSLMLKPPSPDGESYELFEKETGKIFNGLKERSEKLVEGLNSIPGISCVPAQGAMYAFPRVEVPEKAIEKARELGTTPDNLYALSLLEETGICVVPASGFGQAKGRVGFRTTFLHPDTVKAVELFRDHHMKFVEKYT
eukprot:Nitzschia sp. Nitz4//scaffold476_size6971//4995//6965//NITZ4_009165-RA/size6971-augustus-gene-0.0-mRNA-1//1//CDS//3329552721//5038//frame0